MIFVNPLNAAFIIQNSEAENLVLIEMLDANEDGEVDSFEWTTMLSQVRLRVLLIILVNCSVHLVSGCQLSVASN